MAAVVLTSTEGLSRDEWLAYRNLGIGGSDASVVFGVNKYKSPIELFMEKTGQVEPTEAGEPAYWGTLIEPLIRTEFSLREGLEVIPVKQILRSKEYPFMLANLDGVCRCPKYGKCVFEAKTADAYKAGEWKGDSVPQEYVLQLQHYLCVTGYNGAYIAVLIGGNTFQWKFVKRDEEMISMLIRYEREFWHDVQNNIPPSPDGSDACANFLSRRYPESVPMSKIILPDSAADLIRDYSETDEQIKILTAQKQKAANTLKEMLGENELGITGTGDGYIKWQTVSQERFDTKLLETEQPEIYKQYTVKSTHRRFSVKAAEQLSGEAG